MPGYCVAGTIGHKVLSGQKKIEIDKKMVSVRLSVQYMSFRLVLMLLYIHPSIHPSIYIIFSDSAHADAKGIMQLIRQVLNYFQPTIHC